MIPREYRSQIEPAQFFHEVLDHRWFLAEKAGHDVPMGEAVTSFVAGRPDVFLFGFRSVFYVLMAVAAAGFALAMVRLVKMRARH